MDVTLAPHDPGWKIVFAQEAEALIRAMPGLPIELHHIGSTAIPGILAKPIIDLLGEVADVSALDQRSAAFAALGYDTMGEFGMAGRRYFRKFDAKGRRTHHLHVFQSGTCDVERHLAFRDFLRAHPARAADYSALKAGILADGAVSWDAYINRKGHFVTAVEKQAVDWYRRHKSDRD